MSELQALLAQLDKERLSPEMVNAVLVGVSKHIFPEGVVLMWVKYADLREQDINAQSMPKAMFDQLVNNIKSAGFPESVILCVQMAQGIEIISGHHRKRSSVAAGVEWGLAIVYQNLSRAKIHAKQLAHNSIHGTSDAQIVKQIWDRIDDVQARFEAFIDPKIFDSLPSPVSFKPVDVDMLSVSKTVMLVFLPTQKMDFDQAIEALMPKTQVDAIYLAHREVYDQWIDAFKRVRSDLEIVNAPSAMVEMARLAVERLDELAEGEADGQAD